MNFKHLAVALLLLSAAACTTPTPFAPATTDDKNGYTDQRLADNRYRITFTGNSATKRDTVENYLLLRAAEVTRDAGFAWFEFDTRDTQANTTYHTDFAGYPGWGWGRGFGWYGHSWRYDPWDSYWGGTNVTIPTTSYQAYAEIVLLTPDEAKGNAKALQASDVIARLGPQAAPPPGTAPGATPPAPAPTN